jgi:hypothetical protein
VHWTESRERSKVEKQMGIGDEERMKTKLIGLFFCYRIWTSF